MRRIAHLQRSLLDFPAVTKTQIRRERAATVYSMKRSRSAAGVVAAAGAAALQVLNQLRPKRSRETAESSPPRTRSQGIENSPPASPRRSRRSKRQRGSGPGLRFASNEACVSRQQAASTSVSDTAASCNRVGFRCPCLTVTDTNTVSMFPGTSQAGGGGAAVRD